MDWFIILTLVLVLPTAAAYWLRSRWQLDSIHGVAFEVVARILPGPARSVPGLRRTLARRVCATPIVMPSGRVQVPALLEVRISEPDYETLDAVFGCERLEADLATVCRDHADREKWHLPSRGLTVRLTPDPVLHQGWVPAARATLAEPSPAESHFGLLKKFGGEMRETRAAVTRRMGDVADDVVTQLAMPSLVITNTDGVDVALAGCGCHGGMLKDPIVIGRGRLADLRVHDAQSSRRHAEFTCDVDGWMLRDLGSMNGTLVDGTRIFDHPVRIVAGNTIRLGKHGPTLTVKVADPLGREHGQVHHHA